MVNSRLLGGVGANAAWGAQTFGLWLIISAIPSYLALADFGFSAAAANDMTLATARGARAEARGAFQSVLALNAAISLCILVVIAIVLLLLPNHFLRQTAIISSAEMRLVWILQTVQVGATLCCGAFGGGFQSSGCYGLGIFLISTARFLDSLALVVGAHLFHGFAPAAALMLAMRLATLACTAAVLMRVAPWLGLGFRHASFANIRRLAAPALAVTAVPAAFAAWS